jgi:hypothetical protein
VRSCWFSTVIFISPTPSTTRRHVVIISAGIYLKVVCNLLLRFLGRSCFNDNLSLFGDCITRCIVSYVTAACSPAPDIAATQTLATREPGTTAEETVQAEKVYSRECRSRSPTSAVKNPVYGNAAR